MERRNRDMKAQLAILLQDDHRDWVDKLPMIRLAMNTAVCQSTNHTSAYLTFVRELRTSDDVGRNLLAIVASKNFHSEILPYLSPMAKIKHDVREQHERAQDQSKKYADAAHIRDWRPGARRDTRLE